MDNNTTQNVSNEASNQVDVSDVTTKDDKVAYESYAKVLNQLKTTKAQFAAMQDELATLKTKSEAVDMSKASSQSDWKALHDQKHKELDAERARNKAIVEDFTGRAIKSSFVSKFKDEGCLDPELLFLEAQSTGKLKGIEVRTDDFTLDSDSLSSLVSEYKKVKGHIFGKQASAVKGEAPKVEAQKIKSYDEMSTDELKALVGIKKGKL